MNATLDVRLLSPAELSKQDQVRLLVPTLKALGEENRLTLALLLAERPRTVKELQEATGMNQTLVSHHLAPLRQRGLVTVEARGRANVYTLCCAQLAGAVRWMATLAAQNPEGAAACCAAVPDEGD